MASCSSLLSEEEFLCSICLDVFTDPVSTHCGHNFCKACITKYWDSNDLCQCPMCKKTFDKRPDLFVNTFISELAAKIRKSAAVKVSVSPDLRPTVPEVPCDVCPGRKLKALKSCLMCLASYCETHLEPHQRKAAFKKHKLIDPVENLEDRLCKEHQRPLELFCRTDQACVCLMCINADHKTHNAVLLEEEYGPRKAKLAKMVAELNLMVETRSRKVQEIKLSVETSRRDADREISDGVEAFAALARSIESSQAELIEVVEEKQKAAEKQAEGFIQELEMEMAELKSTSAELETLSHTDDHLHFLQSPRTLSTPPPAKDWSEIGLRGGLMAGTARRAVSRLEDSIVCEVKKLCEAELRRIQQYAVDVTLDPDTAHQYLILSEDGKTVRVGDIAKDLPDNPERFNPCCSVLGKQSFYSGRFYYEVQVKDKTAWALGVVRESINRKGKITLSTENGYWTIWLMNGDKYGTMDDTVVRLSLRVKPQKVGVWVDYEEGRVSFYDVEARSHIYSFTGCTFTEKLYPYFSPCLNDGGKNSAPLIISPVSL